MRSSSNTRRWPALEGLAARVTTVAAAVAGAALVGGVVSADAQRSAANKAADAQTSASQAGISETQRQFDAVQQLLLPYVQTGNTALDQYSTLAGLNGTGAQQSAISALQQSPQFQALLKQGETSILQNASATGGLRGGNTQAALAQFSPALLAQQLEAQYSRLGGLASLGQNAAARVGNAGVQTGSSISALLQQQGASQAGAAIADGRAVAAMGNSIGSSAAMYAALSGFGNTGGTYNPALTSNIGAGTVSTDYSLGTRKF